MVSVNSNSITGITTTIFDNTDVVNKNYIDSLVSNLPLPSGKEGRFLATTDGVSTSWEYVSNYQEYAEVGTYTFDIPAQSSLFYIEAIGGGGGGSTGLTAYTYLNSGVQWSLRTSGFASISVRNLVTNNSIFLASGDSGRLTSSTDGISWSLRTSGFGTTNISSATYFNNEFLIGGRAETVTWTLRTSGFGTTNINSAVYSNSNYIIGGDSGTLRTSTNSIFWTIRTSGFGATAILNLSASNSVYVSSGNSGRLTSSTDGISWSLRTSGFGTTNISSATYFNNEFLIGGRAETVTWTLRTSGFGTSAIQGMIYGNGIYVIVSQTTAGLSASTDGISWSLRTTAVKLAPFADTDSGIYDGTNYIILGSSVGSGIISSTDTITWTARTAGLAPYAISYGSNQTEKYIIGGAAGALRTSTDSIAWTTRISGFGTTNIHCSLYDGNRYYLGGGTSLNARLNVSTDGIRWETRTTPLTGFITSILYNSTIYLSSTSNGRIASSTDSIIWELRTSGFGTSIVGTLSFYGNNLFVAGSSGGRIATSTDAIVWTTRTSGTTTNIINISTNESGNFVTSGGSGYLSTSTASILSSYGNGALLRASTDTISWTSRTNNTLNSQTIALLSSAGSYSFAHGTNYMNEYDFFNVSTDNIVWEIRTTGFGRSQSATITYGNGIYVCGGTSGTIGTSTDTIRWTLRTSGFGTSLIDTLVYNGLFVAGSYGGQISTSTDAIVWTTRTSATSVNINAIITDNLSQFIVSGNSGYLSTSTVSILSSYGNGALLRASTNSISWTSRTTNINSQTATLLSSAGSYSFAHGTNYMDEYDFFNVSTDNIVWEIRTTGFGRSQILSIINGNGIYVCGGASGTIGTSTDTIRWTLRTSGFGTSLIDALSYGNGLYIACGDSGTITTSTDSIIWSIRTSGASPDNINTISYSPSSNTFIFGGNNGDLYSSTNAISWKITTSLTTSNILTSLHSNNVYLVAGDSGTILRTLVQYSGTGGSSGSYTSWYIPKVILSSSITINVGSGGIGATLENTSGAAGAGTTISWTGPGGNYKLVASGGSGSGVAGAAQTDITNYFYTTSGIDGATFSNGIGITALSQINQFQSTGGGSGTAIPLSSGGDGGSINIYGNNIVAIGGNNLSVNGNVGFAFTSIPYGNGGGGGGATSSIAGAGGSGGRGAGGGGGAAIINSFGNGGNGGNGYVRITWW